MEKMANEKNLNLGKSSPFPEKKHSARKSATPLHLKEASNISTLKYERYALTIAQ